MLVYCCCIGIFLEFVWSVLMLYYVIPYVCGYILCCWDVLPLRRLYSCLFSSVCQFLCVYDLILLWYYIMLYCSRSRSHVLVRNTLSVFFCTFSTCSAIKLQYTLVCIPCFVKFVLYSVRLCCFVCMYANCIF